MRAFSYRSASSAENAAKWLGAKALPLAGGSSLLNLIKEEVLEPDTLVNIKDIPQTVGIEDADGGLRIGANTTIATILESEKVKKDYPALWQAVYNVGSPQIRNVGTLGGNLCTRPITCWYYAHRAFDCLKRTGNTCPARDGENDHHAILDNDSSCVMVHPSSSAPALVVHGATVRVTGADGAREVEIEKFFVSPRADPRRETVLKPNEIVTHITLGAPNPHSATYEVRYKLALDWPLALTAVSLAMEGEKCREARICLGAVAPTPHRVPQAEALLAGKAVTAETAAAAAKAAVENAKSLGKNAHKIQLAETTVKRALLLAARGKL
jgi:xanthine dehydrogenase YagS FAD-binding subunit